MQARVILGFILNVIRGFDEALLWAILVLLKMTRLFKHRFGLAVTRSLSSEVHGVNLHLAVYQDHFYPQQRKKTLFLPASNDDWLPKLSRNGVLGFWGFVSKTAIHRC
jgi:hypothetical protein